MTYEQFLKKAINLNQREQIVGSYINWRETKVQSTKLWFHLMKIYHPEP